MSAYLHYIKLFLFIVTAAVAGELLVYIIKNLILNIKSRFQLEVSGMIERSILVLLIYDMRPYLVWAMVMMVMRGLILASIGSLRLSTQVLNRKEPALEFQKIKIKIEIIAEVLASPLVAIAIGKILFYF